MALLVRTGGSRHTGLAAPPHCNIQDGNETNDTDGSVDRNAMEKMVAVKALNNVIKAGIPWKEQLWTCVRLWQGEEFRTAGRGKTHSGSTAFTYSLKKSSRTGEENAELVISTKKQSKTVTRSSVELAMVNALEEMRKMGYVSGPKKLGQIFGGSYLYAMFLEWGVITDDECG